MRDHRHLLDMHARSLAQQEAVRRAVFSPGEVKTLRRFSIWEISQFMFGMPADTLRQKIAEDPALPQGCVEGQDGRQRWFTLDEINILRRAIRVRGRSLMPPRPPGRAVRVAVANFKGGVGKSVVTQHFAHAAALDGWRVLLIDFDPQATLTHAMGLVEVDETDTVWGIMGRDLCREADRIMAGWDDPEDCPWPGSDELPAEIRPLRDRAARDFIRPTCWPTIDIVPSCANAAFVEFASAQYRALHGLWTFFRCVERFLAELDDDAYDLVVFDCPPAIGYQSLNAAFAADVLLVPAGPGYWEYDSTTSFLGQLGDALGDIAAGFARIEPERPAKAFDAVRILMTRYEPGNPLHQSMAEFYGGLFGAEFCRQPVELSRAVEQAGRFQRSVYEQDYREMTRETWKRARASFDASWAEMRATLLAVRGDSARASEAA